MWFIYNEFKDRSDSMDYDIDSFIEYLSVERNYSEYTCVNYRDDIVKFKNFITSETITSFKDVDYQLIRNYLNFLYNKKEATKSITRNISALRSFFKYLIREDKIKSNPMTLVYNPKQEKRLPHYLTSKELDTLLSVTSTSDLFDIRDNMIIELLYSTGIRVGEAVKIKLSDIDFNDESIKVLGKGNKERIVYFGGPCKDKIKRYLPIREQLLKDKNNPYLLINKRGNQICDRGIRTIFENIIKKNNLKICFSPHTLRHTYATDMLNDGMDVRSVQELLGHADISTTGIYTHVSNEHLRKVYLSCHPRSGR